MPGALPAAIFADADPMRPFGVVSQPQRLCDVNVRLVGLQPGPVRFGQVLQFGGPLVGRHDEEALVHASC